MNFKKTYIEVLLPLPVEGSFMYSVPENFPKLEKGQRVVVQFGIRKLYTAIVLDIHDNIPELKKVKDVLAILDESNLVNEKQLVFWKWISSYYMCKIGDVMNAALPSSLKLASESRIIVHPDFDGDTGDLNTKENLIISSLLLNQRLTISEVSELTQSVSIFPVVNNLIRKQVVCVEEELHDSYKKKRLLFVDIEEKDFDKCLEKVKSSKKQEKLLRYFNDQKRQYPKKKWTVSELLKKTGFNRGILNSLVKKGLLKVEKNEVSRLPISLKEIKEVNKLSDAQEESLRGIKSSFKAKNVCLLHGVTSSGKTEIYINLILEYLKNGKQVLYLLPEIALTTQIITRLQNHFGKKVGIFHSRMSNNERVEVWNAVKEKDLKKTQYHIILGSRSSVFLPFDNLGLIIVDEEHDSSFKQHQSSPRYHARDAAIFLSVLHKSKVLLGSATPCIETYYKANKGKFGLVELNSRFRKIQLPEIHIIDLKKSNQRRKIQYYFSDFLIKNIENALERGKQIILFQNRRGFAPLLECENCSWTPKCHHCDVSLTYHKYSNSLRCHYCGYNIEKILICKSCGYTNMEDKGFGTEQIEEELKTLFPEVRIQRMDYDTTRRKNAYSKIINNFERGLIDILVGTQMVTKGLDFDNVELVGVLNADGLLKFPDFRALERSYQVMSQVSGRAGRKGDRGKVIIQTFDVKNQIIHQVKNHDYNLMYTQQIEERKLFKYPPFYRIISINLQHKNQQKLDDLSNRFSVSLKKNFGERVLGPETPAVSKIKSYYHKNILLKIETKASINNAKDILSSIIQKYKQIKDFRILRINIDVDPN